LIYALLDTAFEEINIFGDNQGYALVASALRSQVTQHIELAMPTAAIESMALVRQASTLRVVPGEGLLRFSSRGDEVVVMGSRETLQWLAEYLEEMGPLEGKSHVHLEHYDGHPKLDPSHVGTVLCGLEAID